MTAPRCELRLGDWRETLAGETCDLLLCDPPYSARTHSGERGTRLSARSDAKYNPTKTAPARNGITYAAIDESVVAEFVTAWTARVGHWVVMFGDDISWRWWRDAWDGAGWVTFAPVVWVKSNPPPRFSGDGPTSSCEYILVARPRGRLDPARTGSRPGHYDVLTQTGRGGHAPGVVGAKDVGGMRAIIRDYSLRGDTIIDPFAGSGSTLLAARVEGRHSLGSELDPKHHEIARKRLAAGWTPRLFAE